MIVIPLGDASGVLTKEALDQAANPQLLGQLEAYPQPLYDTQSVANGDKGPYQFFVATNTDTSVTNLTSPGQLAADQYFILQYITADWLQAPSKGTDAAVNPNVADWSAFFVTGNPTLSLLVSQKEYGPYPLWQAGASGGASGFMAAEGATAAGWNVAVLNNGIPGQGGISLGGAVILTPRKTFKVVVSLAAGTALTMVAGAKLRINLHGALYRNVQ